MVGTGFFMPKTWDSIDGAAASRAPSKPKDTTLPACAAAAKESDTRPLGASDTLHKESRRDGPAHESAGTNTKECACDASRPSISTSTSMRRRYQLPKLAANCGNRPFTSETCAVPPSICRSRSSQEQLSASSLQYVAIPWMAPSQSNGVCIWDELEVPRSYRGNGIAGGPSMGGASPRVGTLVPTHMVSGGVLAAHVGVSSYASSPPGAYPALPPPSGAPPGGQYETASYSHGQCVKPYHVLMPRQGPACQVSLMPQCVAHGIGSAQPAGACCPDGDTAQQYYFSQDVVLLQPQQATAAAPGTTFLQVQPWVPAGSGVLGGMCSSSTGLLWGPAPGPLHNTAASNTSSSVLGPGVLLSAPGNTSACGDSGSCSLSAVQQFTQPVYIALAPSAQGAQIGPAGFPAQLPAPVSVLASAVMPAAPPAPAGPGGYGSSMGNQGVWAEQVSNNSSGLVSGPQVTGSDMAAAATALAQDKLAQMQQLEALQQQLKRDVVTLLPYLEPARRSGGQP